MGGKSGGELGQHEEEIGDLHVYAVSPFVRVPPEDLEAVRE